MCYMKCVNREIISLQAGPSVHERQMAFSGQYTTFADLLACPFVHICIGSDVVNKSLVSQNNNYLALQTKAVLQQDTCIFSMSTN